MRRATLWSVMLAAALAACGGDSGSDESPGDGDGDTEKDTDDVAAGNGDDNPAGDGDGNAAEPLCPIAQGGGLGAYEGVKTWTQEDFMACQTACPMFDDACIATSCAAGFDTFNTCVGTNINACLSATDGPCRGEFEAHLCCADEKCDLADAAAADCVAAQCAPTRDGFLDCGETGGIEACIGPAAVACFAAPAADDAAGGTTTIVFDETLPSELNLRLSISRSWR